MANIKSAKKRILVIETKTLRNKSIKSKVNILLYFIDFWAICQVENENF